MVPALGQGRFALSVQLTPIYTHSDAKIVFPFADQVTQLSTTEFVAISNGLNYSLGITGRYSFSSKWSISTGIWANHALAAKSDFTQNGIPFTLRYHYNHPFTNSYRAPLLINYQSSIKRLSPYFSVGTTFDFRATSYVDLNGNGDLTPIKIGKAIVVTPFVGIGILYGLTEHMSLIAQPIIQYNVEPHSSYTYFHAYQVGVQTRLMYKL